MRNHLFEALVGLVVVLLAAWLVFTFVGRTASGAGSNAIEVTAYFPDVGGISVGTDVRVAGLSIGEVTDVALNPEDFQAEVRMAIDPSANLPNDSSAAITSEGLLGGSYIALLPGASPDPFAQDDVILDTQGAIDMTGLIGSMINDSGGSDSMGDTMSEDFGSDDFGDTMSDDFGDEEFGAEETSP
ncbi:outer membrane lipid asymmetry maintenance protein MlaD [Parasphingopyxis sp.]|uniref:outer membrane lipid asymmetry maintenance protein MlaD n=1 Tax=Parasphingopyxis sp. TaxID=1920299 RepID=UPI002609CE57|nr:outer membrane lipid asymmetry maintenance protein MlaD [Parasphingopyxis sp.]